MVAPVITSFPVPFYLASGLENRELAAEAIRLLEETGLFKNTYNWTNHGSLQSKPELWESTSLAEAEGVKKARILFVLLPGGRGTHTELGIAIGCEIPIVFIGSTDEINPPNGRTCIFYYHPLVWGRVDRIECLSEFTQTEYSLGTIPE